MMPELGTAQAVTDLLNKMEEEAEQREQEAKQLFERFYIIGTKDCRLRKPSQGHRRPRRSGFGQSDLSPIGSRNTGALLTSW